MISHLQVDTPVQVVFGVKLHDWFAMCEKYLMHIDPFDIINGAINIANIQICHVPNLRIWNYWKFSKSSFVYETIFFVLLNYFTSIHDISCNRWRQHLS